MGDLHSPLRVALIIALHQQDSHQLAAESVELSLYVIAIGMQLEISPDDLIKVTDADYNQVIRVPPHTTTGEFQEALDEIDKLERRDRVAHVMQTQEK